MTIEQIRARLDKLEAERTHPFIRLRADELRALLEELDACEDATDELVRQLREKQK